jgi:hypothetical protein
MSAKPDDGKSRAAAPAGPAVVADRAYSNLDQAADASLGADLLDIYGAWKGPQNARPPAPRFLGTFADRFCLLSRPP